MSTNNRITAPTRRGILTNGPFWLTVSVLLFAVMAVTVRMAGLRGVPGSETTLIRFIFGMATVGVLHYTGVVRIRLHRKWLLAARGIFGGIAILFYFLSLASASGAGATSLTNAVFLGNSYFIYAPLFGAMLIHERLRRGTVLSVVVALFGLYLVAQPDLRGVTAGDVYGFLAGIISGVAIVTIRELRRTESAFAIFLSLSFFGALAGLITMFTQNPVWPDAIGWLLLLVMGITSTAGQLTMTYALRFTGVGPAGVIQMTTVVYSSAAGILWFGDPFTPRILLGGLIVLGAGAYISLTSNGE